VRLVGACRSCPAQSTTLSQGVERAVRELVPEIQGLLVDQAAPKVGQGGYWGVY
jgi:Fe-S cluster biogenesis protein NfuA